jgi:hypothetical protein
MHWSCGATLALGADRPKASSSGVKYGSLIFREQFCDPGNFVTVGSLRDSGQGDAASGSTPDQNMADPFSIRLLRNDIVTLFHRRPRHVAQWFLSLEMNQKHFPRRHPI